MFFGDLELLSLSMSYKPLKFSSEVSVLLPVNSPLVFNGQNTPKKFLPQVESSLKRDSSGLPESRPRTASRSNQQFSQDTQQTDTDRQTDRQTERSTNL